MHPLGFETGSKTGKGYAGNMLVIQAGTFVIVDGISGDAGQELPKQAKSVFVYTGE